MFEPLPLKGKHCYSRVSAFPQRAWQNSGFNRSEIHIEPKIANRVAAKRVETLELF